MTTITDTQAPPSRTAPTSFGHRIARVVKLHLANPWTPIFVPAMILAFIFLANYAVWQIILANSGDAELGGMNNGGVGFVLIYMLVIAVQTMNATFPFAMGYGVTRRDFYVGSAAFYALLTLGFSVVLTVLAEIERATGGWGVSTIFFAPDFAGVTGILPTFYQFVVLLLFFFFVGAAVATVFVRWKANGLYVFFASLVAILLAAGYAVTQLEGWGRVGQFFVDAGYLGTLNWSLLVTALMAVAGYLILRRAAPRNS